MGLGGSLTDKYRPYMEIPDNDMLVYNKLTGTYRKAKTVTAVNRFFDKLHKEGPWKAIDLIVSRWEAGYPAEKEEFYKTTKRVRESRANKHASSKKNAIRYLAEVPTRVRLTIDRLIPDTLLDTHSKDFYIKFAKRYPQFAIPDKI